ncbi:MAG: ATP-binding cassette domain-containing protein [Victivallales bacterium]|nr:ATP-binding cassette domain-containing protein [Victivallales bacterium]
MPSPAPIVASNLTLAYDDRVIMRDLSFQVEAGSVFIIMGPSGCGKSTLLRHLIGLQEPASGTYQLFGKDFWKQTPDEQAQLMKRVGILYQRCGLWSSMTIAQNIALPLQQYTTLSQREIQALCEYKLSLVGLGGYGNFYPSELSGGMQKRAGLARAMALDPEILFFDEPSSGLDPVSANRLDELMLQLQKSLNSTLVVVTHDLDSIFTIGTTAIFLDPATKSMTAQGNPRELLRSTEDPSLREFLSRGGIRK